MHEGREGRQECNLGTSVGYCTIAEQITNAKLIEIERLRERIMVRVDDVGNPRGAWFFSTKIR